MSNDYNDYFRYLTTWPALQVLQNERITRLEAIFGALLGSEGTPFGYPSFGLVDSYRRTLQFALHEQRLPQHPRWSSVPRYYQRELQPGTAWLSSEELQKWYHSVDECSPWIALQRTTIEDIRRCLT